TRKKARLFSPGLFFAFLACSRRACAHRGPQALFFVFPWGTQRVSARKAYLFSFRKFSTFSVTFWLRRWVHWIPEPAYRGVYSTWGRFASSSWQPVMPVSSQI